MGFGEPGGTPLDPAALRAGELKSELVQLAGQGCMQHASRIVDLILRDYVVTRR